MVLISKEDLKFGRKGVIANLCAAMIEKIFAIDKINALETDISGSFRGEESAALLRRLEIDYNVQEHDLGNIPTRGAVIVVCNHPTGAPDGIILIDLLSKIRPDVKIMGNFLLGRLSSFKEYFIGVDPFGAPDRNRNFQGTRRSLEHLRDGGLLVIFPAGEVSTWQNGFRDVRDRKWGEPIVKFIRNARCPVIPVCIEARNSFMFRLLGKIDPRLRTAMLPREMINKRGKSFTVNIGSGVLPRRTAGLDVDCYGRYLRANVEFLHTPVRRHRGRRSEQRPEPLREEILPPLPREELERELASLPAECLLFEQSGYRVYFAEPQQIRRMLSEIGRMREITFREIGEGSLKTIDTDHYDDYYHQLFVWDTAARALVGAYRLGMGAEIMEKHGLRGFYTDTLFRLGKEMGPVMSRTIELGRSFVTRDYQRKTITLVLLWKGILYILLQHVRYRNLMGPVTISGEFSDVSKTLIVNYLQKHHLHRELSDCVRPVTGLDGVNARIDFSLVEDIESIDLMNKIVTDIERNEFSIPVLIRKYLNLNSYVLAFNVDHNFSDCLDCLMLLDLKRVPHATIELLSRELSDIDVISRFKNI